MKARRATFLASVLGLILWATPAFSGTVSIHFAGPVNAPNNTYGGVYVGLYQGTVNNVTTNFVCDDFLHGINEGQNWTANVGNATPNSVSSTAEFSWSDVSNPDLKSLVGAGNSLSPSQLYSMIIYLAEQIFNDPTNSKGQWAYLSWAIWSITDGAWQYKAYYTATVKDDITSAFNAMENGTVTGSLIVYTPCPASTGQEFLGTPEPATTLLLCLALLGGGVFRRRLFT